MTKDLGAIQTIMASADVRELINKNFVYYVAQTLKMSNEALVNSAVFAISSRANHVLDTGGRPQIFSVSKLNSAPN
ncbi:MAG: hypothetical protein H7326_07655 [Bdellovibrionaceae bacterium]|nr:hypothetical protein [Pseudobdellovibrionaceae bacterium]